MKRVFIDAMIYINYFAAQSVESKILSQVETLIDQGKIKLVFPEITFDEVYRNSVEEISTHKKKITFPALISVLPPSVSKSDTYKEAKVLSDQLNGKMDELQKKYQESVDQLMQIVESLKSKAENVSETEDLIEKAHTRRLLGKLPYFTKSIDGLGDGIVWELLLGINDTEETVIVTEDGGWKNQNANALHPAMEREWKNGKRGGIKLYHSLAGFLKKEFPDVKISKEDLELDKKTSQPNPSAFPYIFPSNLGSASLNLGTSRISQASGLVGPITRISDIICMNCLYPIPDTSGSILGVIIICPFCGAQNPV